MTNEPNRFNKGIVLKNISDGVDASDTNPACNISGHVWVIETVTSQTAVVASSACSVSVCCDKFTLACHGLSNGQLVKITTSCTIPGGLTAYTACNLQKYYIVGVSGSDFQVSATRGGAAVNLTSTGTGNQTFTVMEEQLQVYLCAAAEKILTDSNKVTVTNKTLTTPTLTSPVINGCVSGTAILDEDNMASDSATKLATQQSIKAYVDAQVTAQDLDFTDDSCTAGLSIDLDSETFKIAGGDGAVTSGSGNTLTVSACITTATDKITPVAADELLLADSAAAGAIKKADVASFSSAINHDCTSGFVADEHVAHSGVCIVAGSGLTGGGNISASRTLNVGAGCAISVGACAVSVCITGAVDKVTPIAADEILLADSAAAGAIKKADIASISSAINHDCTAGFVADEHVAHSGVCIVAGSGLTGGGNISASRTLNVGGTANQISVGCCAVAIADCVILPGTGAMTVPDGTTAQRPACAANGMFRYNTCCSAFEGYANCAWGAIGGGGAGSKDIYYQEDFEGTVDHTNFTTGKNATFGGAGCISGTLATESACPIAGCNSLKFTLTACSVNDWFKSPAITLDDKQSGNFTGITIYYTYTGAACDIKFVLYDNTGTSVLTNSLDLLECACNPTRFTTTAFIPSTSASIAWGAQVVSATACAVLKIDDVELSTNPFVYKNLVETQYVDQNYDPAAMTAAICILRFGCVTFNGADILSYDDSNGRFTANRKAIVNTSFSSRSATANNLVTIYKNTCAANRDQTGGASIWKNVSATLSLEPGDYFRYCVGNALANGVTQFLTITAIAESEHVITPAKSNMTDWTCYTPGTAGLGCVTITKAQYRRVGDSVELNVKFTTGTVAASEAQVNLPTGLTVKSGLTNIKVGDLEVAEVSNSHKTVIATAGDSFVNFGRRDTGAGTPFTPGNGTAVFANGTVYSFIATVPIEEWSSNVTFLAAIPTQLTAYVKDVKADGTNGGSFCSGAWRTRVLNTLEGDCSFVTLSCNQFALSNGKYDIEWIAPAYQINSHVSRLYNVTDASEVKLGSAARTAAASDTQTDSVGYAAVEITSSKTYRIEHQAQTTRATDGFGSQNQIAGVDEVYTQVKITKIK